MRYKTRKPLYVLIAIFALLCGFGGGNFASSMANISFFYPQSQKGTALGLNAGLGNLGVSTVQFVVPLVIGIGLFGSFGGDPQVWVKAEVTKNVWLQNAGFIGYRLSLQPLLPLGSA